ncbi:TVP38/TMEM64 family protein [Pectinatus sottacetonis]|uniref:TVP38/TMEM64 family protein n=1 Tax=Pectinatus sottacetonis TaxID=1002795 RepID=UPI0018C79BCC|nr:TVP38/TMEM64 family protein [Pectinatus sottacetonis]
MKSEKKVKIAGYLLLLILIGGIQIADPTFYSNFFHVLISGDMKEITAYINSFGTLAIFFGFMLVLLVNIVGLPSIFAITANGLLFGPVIGIIISWLAETIGVIIGFWLMRTILRPSAEKLIKKSSKLTKIDDFSGKNGFKVMFIFRSLPYFPSGLLTALGAISRISLKDYSLASFLGKIPATILEVMIGHDIFTYQQNLKRLTIIIVITIIIYGGIWLINKKNISNKN